MCPQTASALHGAGGRASMPRAGSCRCVPPPAPLAPLPAASPTLSYLHASCCGVEIREEWVLKSTQPSFLLGCLYTTCSQRVPCHWVLTSSPQEDEWEMLEPDLEPVCGKTSLSAGPELGGCWSVGHLALLCQLDSSPSRCRPPPPCSHPVESTLAPITQGPTHTSRPQVTFKDMSESAALMKANMDLV